jgi:hypothetical protein
VLAEVMEGKRPFSFSRAAFLAQLYRKSSVEEWLTYVTEERVALEEAVYSGVKQEMAAKIRAGRRFLCLCGLPPNNASS